MIYKIIGYVLLFVVFAIIFDLIWYTDSFKAAVLTFICALGMVSMIVLATYLITK